MSFKLLLSTLVLTLLTSCGYVSTSLIHYSHSPSVPHIYLEKGETLHAYKHRIGYPPVTGGNIPSLIAKKPYSARHINIPRANGSDSYIYGRNKGTTYIYMVNGMVDEKYNRSNNLTKENRFCKVTVIE